MRSLERVNIRTNERTYVLTYIRTGQTLYPRHNFVVRGDNKIWKGYCRNVSLRDNNKYSYNIKYKSKLTLFRPYTGFGDICREFRPSSDAANMASEYIL